MNAVFFEANHDTITKSVHSARRKALASNSAYPEIKLFGFDAYSVDVASKHSSNGGFALFSGMGHGDPIEFTGQNNSIVYDVADSRGINRTVVGAVVHLFSCNCGQKLGPALVKSGAKAFIGYTRPVNIPTTAPVVDEFVKVAAAIDNSILSGDTSATTKRKADAEASAIEARLLSAGSTATPRDVASFRINNRSMVGPWSGSQYGVY